MDHPLKSIWSEVEALFREGAPETVILPRDEIIRLCKAMYFYGISNMSLGLLTLESAMKDDHDKDFIRLRYMEHTGEWVKSNRVGSFEQILATMKAHDMPEIVKVQFPQSHPDGLLLVYAAGRRNLCIIEQTPDLVSKLGGQAKAYFNATWTGKTWVIRDRVPEQPW